LKISAGFTDTTGHCARQTRKPPSEREASSRTAGQADRICKHYIKFGTPMKTPISSIPEVYRRNNVTT
jgi:hypothetical protein